MTLFLTKYTGRSESARIGFKRGLPLVYAGTPNTSDPKPPCRLGKLFLYMLNIVLLIGRIMDLSIRLSCVVSCPL